MAFQPIFQNTTQGGMSTEQHIDHMLGNSYQIVKYVAQQMRNIELLSGTLPPVPNSSFPVLPQPLICGVPTGGTGPAGPQGPVGPAGPTGPQGPAGTGSSSSNFLKYTGQLTTGALFVAAAGLPTKAVVTSVLVASGGNAFTRVPLTKQILSAKNIHINVSGGVQVPVVGLGLPAAVEAGEWVPSPDKEALAPGKFMAAYWGDYTSYKGYGLVGTVDSMTGLWTENPAGTVPQKYWSLDYVTKPGMMGGNVAPGGERIELAKQLSHIYYAFFLPNCSYAEWKRFLPFMEIPPPKVFGTIEDAIAKGGANKGMWTLDGVYNPYDIVLHNGVYYAALEGNTGQNPFWETSGVSSEWVNGAYGDPTTGQVIPVKADGVTPSVPLEPGVGYKGFSYMNTRRPFTTIAGMMSAPAGIGPGTVWKTPDGKFWCGLTWAGYHDVNGLGSTAWGFHDGSYHTQGAGDEAATTSAHRRIYWYRLIPKGALVPTDTDTWQTFKQKLPELRVVNPNLKVCLSLGGWSRSHYFSVCLADPVMRAACVESCLSYCSTVQSYGGFLADGIDLDWETPGGNGPDHNVINGVWPDGGGNIPTPADLAYATSTGTHGALTRNYWSDPAEYMYHPPNTPAWPHPLCIKAKADATRDPTVNALTNNRHDKTYLAIFIKDLHNAFAAYKTTGGRHLEISCALVVSDYAIYNHLDAFDDMDHVMLMSYIFYGTWQSNILPFAGLHRTYGGDSDVLSVVGFAKRLTRAFDGTDANGLVGDGRLGKPTTTGGNGAPSTVSPQWAELVECKLPNSKVVIGTTSNGATYLSSDFEAVAITNGYRLQSSTGVADKPPQKYGIAPSYRSLDLGGANGFSDEDTMYHRYLTGDVQRYWDPVSKTAMYVKPTTITTGGTTWTGHEIISADDVTGFWHKAAYTVNNGYKGMMIWELSGDPKHEPGPAAWDQAMNKNIGGRVEDANGKQFSGVDTMVHVLNRPPAGTEVTPPTTSGEVTVVFSRSTNTAAGTETLATCTVADAANAEVKILYDLL